MTVLLTPSQIQQRLLLAGGSLTAITAAMVFALQGPTFTNAACFVAMAAAWILAILLGRRQVAPVFRAIGRTPPSPAALRDVYLAPEALRTGTIASHAMLALLLWFTGTTVTSLQSALLVLATGGAGSVGISWIAQGSLSTWLGRFSHEDLTTDLRLNTASRLAGITAGWVLTGSSLVALTFIAISEVPAHSSDTSAPFGAMFWIPWTTASFSALLGGLVGRHLDQAMGRLASAIAGSTPERLLHAHGLVQPLEELYEVVRARATEALKSASLDDSATQSIQELQRQKMMFMASTGHDLRSPLNSILGFSELLLSEPQKLTHGQIESLRAINRSGEELLQLLRDILESARVSTGRLDLERSWVPAVEILTHAVEQAHRSIDRTELRIESELQPGLPPVYVDRARVLQALGALLRHASRSAEAGTIRLKATVDARDGQSSLRVEVVDRSEGLRPEDQERIFEAFREVSLPSGKRVGGLGLALSLARSLIVAHDGEISAASTPGVGTTFTISLPIESAGYSEPTTRSLPRLRERKPATSKRRS